MSDIKSMEFCAREYKLATLSKAQVPRTIRKMDNPVPCVEFMRAVIETHERFNPEVESFYVLFLDTRRNLKGWQLVSQGTQDTVFIHPREVFRAAIVAAANSIVIAHNHPSGDPTPSEADIKVTRDLIRAGQLLKIDILDHIILGQPHREAMPSTFIAETSGGVTITRETTRGYTSLRELGYFYS